MSRPALLLAAVCALCACQPASKDAPEAKLPNPAPGDAPSGGVEEEEEAEVEALDEDEEVKVTPSVVASYVDFRKKVLDATRKEFETINERLGKTDKDSTTDQLGLLNEAAKMTERLDARTEALRKAGGLSERQVEVLDDLVGQLTTTAMIVQQLPDMGPIVQSMKAQAKEAPEEQRAEILAEIEKMEQGAKDMREYAEARATFGDAAVEAVLKELPALTSLHKEMMEIFSKLR